jgi:DNA polymerase III epsilon subunit-like protein
MDDDIGDAYYETHFDDASGNPFSPNYIKPEDKVLLFVDTETTGLPKNWNAPISDSQNWPRVVQIAWLTYALSGDLLDEEKYIIKPNGFCIPDESVKIHGITTAEANLMGVDAITVFAKLAADIAKSRMVIAHNLDFDEKVIAAEFHRLGFRTNLSNVKKTCTMKSTTDLCRIQGTSGYKYPSLSELHYKLFNEQIIDGHDALNDIKNTAKCFWALQKQGYYILHENQSQQKSERYSLEDTKVVIVHRELHAEKLSGSAANTYSKASASPSSKRGSPVYFILGLACFILPFFIQNEPTTIGGVFIAIGIVVSLIGFAYWKSGPFN